MNQIQPSEYPCDNSREKVIDLVSRSVHSGMMFQGKDANALCGPCVYLWMRGKDVLYIGKSRNGGARVFSYHHHRIGGKFKHDDILMVYPTASMHDATELESLLIAQIQPSLNIADPVGRDNIARALGITEGEANRHKRSDRLHKEAWR